MQKERATFKSFIIELSIIAIILLAILLIIFIFNANDISNESFKGGHIVDRSFYYYPNFSIYTMTNPINKVQLLIHGTLNSIYASFIAFLFAIIIAIVITLMSLSNNIIIYGFARSIINTTRSIPFLALMVLIIYLGYALIPVESINDKYSIGIINRSEIFIYPSIYISTLAFIAFLFIYFNLHRPKRIIIFLIATLSLAIYNIFFDITGAGIIIPFPMVLLISLIAIHQGMIISDFILISINSVKENQYNASYAMGMTKYQTYIHVILPQSIICLFPGLVNCMIDSMKYVTIGVYLGYPEIYSSMIFLYSNTSYGASGYVNIVIYYVIMSFIISSISNIFFKKISIKIGIK